MLGFGVVFTGVEFADTTLLQLYDVNDQPVGGVVAPTSVNAGLSFIGMIRDVPEIARVRIISGSGALDGGSGATMDFVAMDDFIYGEPVPAPGAAAILGLGALVATRRRRA